MKNIKMNIMIVSTILALFSCKLTDQDSSSKYYEVTAPAADNPDENVSLTLKIDKPSEVLYSESDGYVRLANDGSYIRLEMAYNENESVREEVHIKSFVNNLASYQKIPKKCLLQLKANTSHCQILPFDEEAVKLSVKAVNIRLNFIKEEMQRTIEGIKDKETELQKVMLEIASMKKMGKKFDQVIYDKEINEKKVRINDLKKYLEIYIVENEKHNKYIIEIQLIDMTNMCKDEKSATFIQAINKLFEEIASADKIVFKGNDVFTVNQLLNASGLKKRN